MKLMDPSWRKPMCTSRGAAVMSIQLIPFPADAPHGFQIDTYISQYLLVLDGCKSQWPCAYSPPGSPMPLLTNWITVQLSYLSNWAPLHWAQDIFDFWGARLGRQAILRKGGQYCFTTAQSCQNGFRSAQRCQTKYTAPLCSLLEPMILSYNTMLLITALH